MAREDNLIPFKPGQSGNPNGRPKGSVSVIKHIRAALMAQDEEGAKQLAEKLIAQAKEGNPTAIKQILDRIDGPVSEKLEVTNVSLTESERAERVAALLDRGRARRAGQSADLGPH